MPRNASIIGMVAPYTLVSWTLAEGELEITPRLSEAKMVLNEIIDTPARERRKKAKHLLGILKMIDVIDAAEEVAMENFEDY